MSDAGWDALATATHATPFQRPGWCTAWHASFGVGRLAPRQLVRDGALAAVLPLVERPGGRLASPTNWHTPQFGLVATDEAARRTLLRDVLAERPASLTLGFLDPETAAGLAAVAGDAGYRFLERPLTRSPVLTLGASWAELERSLSANLRGDVRRRWRRLGEHGAVTFELHDGRERLEALLDEGLRVEASGWKGAGGSAIDSAAATRRFYGAVAAWAAACGSLRLGFLRLDGRAVGFHLDLEDDGVLYHLKGGYDESFARFSPGKLLHARVIEWACGRGLRRYEFLGADEPYKRQWTSDSRVLVEAAAYRTSPLGLVGWSASRFARPAARRVLARVRS